MRFCAQLERVLGLCGRRKCLWKCSSSLTHAIDCNLVAVDSAELEFVDLCQTMGHPFQRKGSEEDGIRKKLNLSWIPAVSSLIFLKTVCNDNLLSLAIEPHLRIYEFGLPQFKNRIEYNLGQILSVFLPILSSKWRCALDWRSLKNIRMNGKNNNGIRCTYRVSVCMVHNTVSGNWNNDRIMTIIIKRESSSSSMEHLIWCTSPLLYTRIYRGQSSTKNISNPL